MCEFFVCNRLLSSAGHSFRHNKMKFSRQIDIGVVCSVLNFFWWGLQGSLPQKSTCMGQIYLYAHASDPCVSATVSPRAHLSEKSTLPGKVGATLTNTAFLTIFGRFRRVDSKPETVFHLRISLRDAIFRLNGVRESVSLISGRLVRRPYLGRKMLFCCQHCHCMTGDNID